jgi:uncharacterized tellurite resistance protein B-like protein
MFHRFFRSDPDPNVDTAAASPAPQAEDPTGDTATVRRIVAKLDAMPPDRARLVASAAYILARAANADLEISAEETAIIEQELQQRAALDEATAVLIAEMAKLQANTVGGTEDYVVTREFAKLATDDQKIAIIRGCFVISAANGSISAEESSEVNEIAKELDIPAETLNEIRAEFHERLSAVQEVRRIAGQA